MSLRAISVAIVLLLACLASAEAQTTGPRDLQRLFRGADERPCESCNLILISLTNLRADHLGFHGYFRDTSPRLDAFARAGMVFENALSVASWTLPVALSVYTSRYPFEHGVMTRYQATGDAVARRLPPRLPTLVDLLRHHGYRTASFNGSRDYRPSHGLTDRFDEVRSFEADPRALWGNYGSITDVVAAALGWLRENGDSKFFLHLQGYDTHCPFAFPRKDDRFDPRYGGSVDFSECYWTFERTTPIRREIAGRATRFYSLKRKTAPYNILLSDRDVHHMQALYDGEIHVSDQALGDFFDYLGDSGLLDSTIVVFFSEHGEILGKHGRFLRGGPLRGTFYDDVLHVPLVVRHPGLEARRIPDVVSLIDVAPTVLDLLGLPGLDGARGRSLAPLLAGGSLPASAAFAGSIYTPHSRNALFNDVTMITSVRQARWKLIRETTLVGRRARTTYELFDLAADPEELVNRAAEAFDRLEALNSAINDRTETMIDVGRFFHDHEER